MRLAIIDCGTNTFHLLIVDTSKEVKHHKIFDTRVPVKLGEGAINSGFIADRPFERGIAALHHFKKSIIEHKADKVIAFATSAVRDASNGKEFVQKVKRELEIELEIIDGNREADLIYLGNRQALRLNESISLIVDIGGGSTEFILANNKKISWKHSFNLGAARLLERFHPLSPISEKEKIEIHNYLRENLEPLFEVINKYKPTELIGSSGAFDSVVEMIHGELGGEELTEEKTGYSIDIKKYYEVSDLVKNASLEQRKLIKGLTPMRFDMIVVSCLLIDFVLEEFKIDSMRVSTFSLKEGALIDYISREGPTK
ncbi:MAG: phosphatase [Bacteroidetes bacterium]|nr:phosphatase [Bacteroidota bacterium]